jgi:hypothetical protein
MHFFDNLAGQQRQMWLFTQVDITRWATDLWEGCQVKEAVTAGSVEWKSISLLRNMNEALGYSKIRINLVIRYVRSARSRERGDMRLWMRGCR